MNSRSFQFPLFYLSIPFMLLIILLNSPPASSASSAYLDEWFLKCNDSSKCDSISTPTAFPISRNNGTEICGHLPEEMKVKCDGGRATIEIVGAKYDLLGFSTKDRILILAEIGFSDRFCLLDGNISSSSMYAMIDVSNDCGHPGNVYNGKPTCSGTEFSYLPWETLRWDNNVAYCTLSAVVQISPWLLKEVGDDSQRVAQHIIAEFNSERKVDGQACSHCRLPGGVYGYDLQLNQTRCCCLSSSNGFKFCTSSPVAAAPSPSESAMSSILVQKTGKSPSWPKKKFMVVAAIVLGSIILIIFIIIFFIYHTRKRICSSNKDDIEETIKRHSTQIPKRYTYSKLKKITDSFKNKLGQGGFSVVYKGKLPDGREVAVKLLNESKGNGQDFINEVISITRTSHVNIVTFLGFCYERNERALIYEYMPKGSLDNYIFHKGLQKNQIELNWNTLYSIIVGVARGLEYLHRGCNTRILHFDIKPHNILLDDEFCPKISDFGLAKQCRAKQSHVSMTGAKGTIGFMAPEVVIRSFGKVSHKSDVYSYGMLVLEMVGERKSPNEGVGESSEEYFPDWIYKDLAGSERDGNGRQWGATEEEEEMVRKMVVVGLYCIQTLPDDRPSMTEVVAMLEGSVDGLQIPPKPALFQPPAADAAASSSSTLYL